MLSIRRVTFSGDLVALTFGVGDDHGRFDVYVNKTLWRSFDGYAASSGEETVYLALDDGDHTLEVRTTRYRNPDSSGNLVRFKQVQVLETTYDEHTIQYTYDALSRLLEADYDNGATVYTYGFDVAGNLTNMDGASRTYNAANQLTNDGTNTLTYDANGNLTSDGVNAYTWDRANRMLTAPGSTAYQYDGLGNRIQQTVSVVTDYLLDLQPGLVKVLREDDGTNTSHFIHTPQGIHAQHDGANWRYIAQDGLGSVRSLISSPVGVDAIQSYDPFGNPLDSYGAGYGFTGEQTDGNGQVFLRKRYYNPGIGVFNALDADEGRICTPMSLNGYSYVHGNPIINTDPTGMTCCDEYRYEPVAYRACLANLANQHEETPTPVPTATPSCDGYELDPCDKIYLAHLSAAEASLGGEGITSTATLAAVMLSQINRFRRGGQFYGISTGTSYITSGRGVFESQRQHLDTLIREGAFTGISSIGDINTSNQYRVYRRLCSDGALIMPNPPGFQEALDMAESISCIPNTSNPLANFDFSRFGINSREQSELEKIANNILFTEEKSFCTSVLDVIDEWQADGGYGERITNLIPNMYPTSVALFRGSGRRSVMVHDATAFRNPHVNWQCDQASGQRMVWLVTSDPSSPLANRTGCKRCNDGTFTFESGFVTSCEGPEVNTCPIA